MAWQRWAFHFLRSVVAVITIAISLMGCASLKNEDKASESPFGDTFYSDTVVAQGLDATDVDLWSMQNIWWSGSSFFRDMDPSCVLEVDCPKTQRKDTGEFDSKEDFHKDHAEKLGLGFRADWKDIGGRFNVGVLSTDGMNRNREEKIISWRLSHASRCVALNRACTRNVTFLNPSALRRLDELAAQDRGITPDNPAAMQRWYERFVKEFGSHIVTEATHGASLQAINAVDNSCNASTICRKLGLAKGISFADGFVDELDAKSTNFGFEYKNRTCDSESKCLEVSKTKCAAIGGGDGGVSLCESGAPDQLLPKFLTGGNPRDAGSVYDLKLIPIQDVVALIPGYLAHSKQIGKAVDFAACKAPFGDWVLDTARGEHACSCVLQCDAGFALDESKCKCNCQKDDGCEPQRPHFPDPWGLGGSDSFGSDPFGSVPFSNVGFGPFSDPFGSDPFGIPSFF